MEGNSSKRDLFTPPFAGGLGFVELVEKSIERARDKDIVTKSAAIAFYAMIALVPVLVVMITTFTMFVPTPSKIVYASDSPNQGKSQAVSRLRRGIRHILPRSAFEVVDSQIERIRTDSPYTTLSLGIVAALWTASGVFGTICKCMNHIYDRPESRSYLQLKFIAFSMAFLQSQIFMMALIAFFLWPILEPHVIVTASGHLKAVVLEWLIFTVVVLLSFTLLLHIGPTGKRVHSIITPGSILATPAFLVATGIFRTYVQNIGSYHEMYGPLGGVMVLMLWFWIVAIILLSASVVDCVISRHMLEIDDEIKAIPDKNIECASLNG